MKKMIVLAIGSRIMGDDGIGLYLAEALSKRFSGAPIRWILGETDMDYCLSELSEWSEDDAVVILDAAATGQRPGAVTLFPFCELKRSGALSLSMHGLHLFDLLFAVRDELMGFLIGIEPFQIGYALGLSDSMQSLFPEILAKVGRMLLELADP